MRGHITDAEMAALVTEDADQAARAHVEQCDRCRREYLGLRSALRALAAQLDAEEKRSDACLARQRATIHRRLCEPRARQPVSRHAWVPALGAAAILTLLLPGSPPPPPAAPESDEALLASVQQFIRADAPRALSPVVVLIAEVEGARAASAAKEALP